MKNEKADSTVYNEKWYKSQDYVREVGSPTVSLIKDLILKLIPRSGTGLNALDAGCGTGFFTLEFLKRGFFVDSFDITEYAVEKTKSIIPWELKSRLDIQVLDINSFKTNKKYDIILLSEVLEHINDDAAIVKKFGRMLKENGLILITVPFDQSLWSPSDEYSGHIRRYSSERMTKLINNSGLKIEKMWCYGFPILRIYWTLNRFFIGPLLKSTNLIASSKTNQSGTVRRMASHILDKVIRLGAFLLNKLLILDRRLLSTQKGIGLIVSAKKI